MNWDDYFGKMANLVASKSKDRSTKVGCVIVGPGNEVRSTGFNGFARGANDEREDWHQRPKKYKVVCHAEKNAICQAAKTGTPLNKCTAYISRHPCSQCLVGLIQAGIKEVKYIGNEEMENNEVWKEDFLIAEEIASETGVTITRLPPVKNL